MSAKRVRFKDPIGRRRIILRLKKLEKKPDSAVTYVHISGVFGIPNQLAESLTKENLFRFLQTRRIIGQASLLDKFSDKN